MSRKTWSASPLTCAIAAPTALAQSPCGTRITSRHAGEPIGHQERAAADRDQAARRRPRSSCGRPLPRSSPRALSSTAATSSAGRLRPTARHRRSRRSRRPPRRRSRSGCRRRTPAPRGSADSRRCAGRPAAAPAGDEAAAAEPDRHQVGHAEQGAHAADLDDRIGLARKAAAQLRRYRSRCRRHRPRSRRRCPTETPLRASNWWRPRRS